MLGLSLLCIAVLTFFNTEWAVASTISWSYKNLKEGWPKLCTEGKEQSPINLSPEIAEIGNFPPFMFHGYDELYTATIKNTGHSAEIRLANIARTPNVTGGGLNGEYVLDSLHFHWESEHTIDDQRFPLELHLVHYNRRAQDLKHALQHGLAAVFSVLFYNSPDDDLEFSPVFESIEQLQSKPINFNVQEPIQRLELDDFLPRDRAGFYRYRGSLTTPDCTQGVIWTVFTHHIPISKKQLDTFSRFLTQDFVQMKSNYRPVQDLNNRKVQLKISDVISSAEHNTVFHLWFLLTTFVFCAQLLK